MDAERKAKCVYCRNGLRRFWSSDRAEWRHKTRGRHTLVCYAREDVGFCEACNRRCPESCLATGDCGDFCLSCLEDLLGRPGCEGRPIAATEGSTYCNADGVIRVRRDGEWVDGPECREVGDGR